MSKHHEDLLKRFFERTASREEQEELYRILTGDDDVDKSELLDPMIELIKEKKKLPDTEQLTTQEIFNLMVARNEELSRLEEAVRVTQEAPEPKSNSWWKLVAAAMIAFAAGAALYYYGFYHRLGSDQPVAIADQAYETPHTITGKKYISLPDGSKVTLNEGSTLTYDETLGTDTRNVVLSGEAFFDIYHDASRPFMVHTGKFTTTVLGTQFNVRAYEQDYEITVTVKEGKVKVDDDQNQYGTLTPNEKIAVNTTTRDFVKATVNAEAELSWKREFVILDGVTLEEASKILENKYKVKISLANEKLRRCKITSTFLNNEKLEDVLAVVTTAVNATYELNGDQVVIDGEGKGCE